MNLDLSSYSATCSPVAAARPLTTSDTQNAVAAVAEIIVILNDAPTTADAVKLNQSEDAFLVPVPSPSGSQLIILSADAAVSTLNI